MQQGNYPAERTGSLKTTMLQGYQYYGGGNGSGYRGRPGITLALSKMLEKHIDPHNDSRIYWAKEVTFDYSTSHSIRVDYMRFKPINNSISGIEKGDFYCYEIKSSVEDFQSENGHNLIGDYNYYVMPEEVFKAVEAWIPYHVGVLVDGEDGLHTLKKARRKDRGKPISELLLMMWRSSRRDLVKARNRGKGDES